MKQTLSHDFGTSPRTPTVDRGVNSSFSDLGSPDSVSDHVQFEDSPSIESENLEMSSTMSGSRPVSEASITSTDLASEPSSDLSEPSQLSEVESKTALSSPSISESFTHVEEAIVYVDPDARKKRIRLIIIVVVILLVVVGVLLGLFWPRYPTVNLRYVYLQSGVSTYKFSNPNNPSTLAFSASLMMRLRINNNNMYNYYAPVITQSYLLLNDGALASIYNFGQALRLTNAINTLVPIMPRIIWRSEPNVTYLQSYLYNRWFEGDLPLEFQYNQDPNVLPLSDPALAEIYQSCGVFGQPRPMTIRTYIFVKHPLSFLGLWERMYDYQDIQINCPFTNTILNMTLQQIGSPMTSYQALLP